MKFRSSGTWPAQEIEIKAKTAMLQMVAAGKTTLEVAKHLSNYIEPSKSTQNLLVV